MRYLYMPTDQEELAVRGRYDFSSDDGVLMVSETFERYDTRGAEMQVWRSTVEGTRNGKNIVLASHSLVSTMGLERFHLRWITPVGLPYVSVTTMLDHALINMGGIVREVDLPPGYGFATPLPSLARLAFPIDIGEEQQDVGMTFHIRLGFLTGSTKMRPVKFSYTPIGERQLAVQDLSLKARGWRMEAPGLPTSDVWFDARGNCLLMEMYGGRYSWEARLVEWHVFR